MTNTRLFFKQRANIIANKIFPGQEEWVKSKNDFREVSSSAYSSRYLVTKKPKYMLNEGKTSTRKNIQKKAIEYSKEDSEGNDNIFIIFG